VTFVVRVENSFKFDNKSGVKLMGRGWRTECY